MVQWNNNLRCRGKPPKYWSGHRGPPGNTTALLRQQSAHAFIWENPKKRGMEEVCPLGNDLTINHQHKKRKTDMNAD